MIARATSHRSSCSVIASVKTGKGKDRSMSEQNIKIDVANGVSEARNSDKIMMVAATAARLIVGLFTFIILARYLGPEYFGIIASAIAYTGFAAVLTDFGFAISALRQASANPEKASQIIGNAIVAKAVIAVPVTVLGAVLAFFTLPSHWLPIFALVHIGALANSFGELFLIATRARRQFVLEAKLVIASSTLMLILFGGITALTRDLFWAAVGFAVTRTLYLVIIRFMLRGLLEKVTSTRRRLDHIRTALASSRGYAFDQILTVLSGQIDLLLFAAMLTVHEFGVYQAGARLAQVCVSFAPVLSTVYLPALSAAAINGDDNMFRAGSKRLSIEFAALALAGGVAFLILGPIVTPVLYGPEYAGLAPLWPGFAAFVMLRFGASSFGIQLAALGHVRTRVVSSMVSISFLALLTILLLPHYKLSGTSLLMAAGAVPSICTLGVMLLRDHRSSYIIRWILPLILGAAILIILL